MTATKEHLNELVTSAHEFHDHIIAERAAVDKRFITRIKRLYVTAQQEFEDAGITDDNCSVLATAVRARVFELKDESDAAGWQPSDEEATTVTNQHLQELVSDAQTRREQYGRLLAVAQQEFTDAGIDTDFTNPAGFDALGARIVELRRDEEDNS